MLIFFLCIYVEIIIQQADDESVIFPWHRRVCAQYVNCRTGTMTKTWRDIKTRRCIILQYMSQCLDSKPTLAEIYRTYSICIHNVLVLFY